MMKLLRMIMIILFLTKDNLYTQSNCKWDLTLFSFENFSLYKTKLSFGISFEK